MPTQSMSYWTCLLNLSTTTCPVVHSCLHVWVCDKHVLYHQRSRHSIFCIATLHFCVVLSLHIYSDCFTTITSLVQARTNIMDTLLKSPTDSCIIKYPSCGLATPIMDDITYTTHIQTVYIKANNPLPFPQSVRYWDISSTHGILPEIDPQDNATYLEAFTERMVTVPMLQLHKG